MKTNDPTGQNSQLPVVISNPNAAVDGIVIATDWFIDDIVPCWPVITDAFENFAAIGIRVVFRCAFDIRAVAKNDFLADVVTDRNRSNEPFELHR